MSQPAEFKVAGLSMPVLTIAYGLMLVLWGALFSIGSESFTSWIPSIMGAPILISGFLARSFPAKRKVWMHVAVTFGLLCCLGGMRFFSGFGHEDGPFANPKAGASQLMLFVTGGIYTFLCVRSFIWARKNQPAGE